MPYKCAYGCTSYNPNCDACDGETSDQSTGWFEPEEDTRDRFEAAKKGMTLKEFRESEREQD